MILRVVGRIVVCAAALGIASGCAADRTHEDAAVQEFHRQLERGRVDLIYADSSTFLRDQLSEAQFRHLVAQTRKLGRFEDSDRAQVMRTPVPGQPDLVVAFYNSRYAKASCLESFSWRAESGALKLASYSCAPNMQVSCPFGSACETSPIPSPGLASLP